MQTIDAGLVEAGSEPLHEAMVSKDCHHWREVLFPAWESSEEGLCIPGWAGKRIFCENVSPRGPRAVGATFLRHGGDPDP